MHSRWYNFSVVALWITTMTWLVTQKILPSLLVGDPPERTVIISAQLADRLVGWDLLWGKEPIGWAWNRTDRMEAGGTCIRGRIHFDRLPLRQFVPEMFQSLLTSETPLPAHVPLDSSSALLFDREGKLTRLESSVAFDPDTPAIEVAGVVADGKLVITVRSAGFSYETKRTFPKDVMLGDALSPHTQLPGLWQGRKWTVELFSPLRPPNDPVEIVQAEVVGREPIVWNGQAENAWLVVFRGDPGGEVGNAGRERTRLWVRDDGVVLQQQVSIFTSTMTFVRMTLEQELKLNERLDRQGRIEAVFGGRETAPPALRPGPVGDPAPARAAGSDRIRAGSGPAARKSSIRRHPEADGSGPFRKGPAADPREAAM